MAASSGNFYHWNFGRILGWADGEWEDFDWVYAEIFVRSARLAFINVLITLAVCYPAAPLGARACAAHAHARRVPDHAAVFRQPGGAACSPGC